MAKVLTLDDVNVDGKTVLLRVDINSPLDPATKSFLDDTRIRAILPTLQKLVKAKVIILAHQSRPGKNDFTSTLGHARELGRTRFFRGLRCLRGQLECCMSHICGP